MHHELAMENIELDAVVGAQIEHVRGNRPPFKCDTKPFTQLPPIAMLHTVASALCHFQTKPEPEPEPETGPGPTDGADSQMINRF